MPDSVVILQQKIYMTVPAFSSYCQWYRKGPRASYVYSMKSLEGMLSLLEATQPAGDMSDPVTPESVYTPLKNGELLEILQDYPLAMDASIWSLCVAVPSV